MPVSGCFQMLGDQRSVLVGRFRAARFDGCSEPAMQFGAIGFQL